MHPGLHQKPVQYSYLSEVRIERSEDALLPLPSVRAGSKFNPFGLYGQDQNSIPLVYTVRIAQAPLYASQGCLGYLRAEILTRRG